MCNQFELCACINADPFDLDHNLASSIGSRSKLLHIYSCCGEVFINHSEGLHTGKVSCSIEVSLQSSLLEGYSKFTGNEEEVQKFMLLGLTLLPSQAHIHVCINPQKINKLFIQKSQKYNKM